MQTKTSLSNSKAGKIWSQFMPRLNEVKNNIGSDLFSIQVYPNNFKKEDFTLDTIYTTWAAIEVTDSKTIPNGMESQTIEGGLYAVFNHKGATNNIDETFEFIFNKWIPNSDYEVDNRKHFEILGEKYFGPNDPNSEEEIWMPIKEKQNVAYE